MDTDLKTQADTFFAELSMNLSTAFNIFVRQPLREVRIPFGISLNYPNKETIVAMLEAERIAKDPSVKGCTDLDELFVDQKMRKTKYIIKLTTQFKKDYKLAIKRGLEISLPEVIMVVLAMGKSLPDKNKDHTLGGNWGVHRECHIQPDWLLKLIYTIVLLSFCYKLYRHPVKTL